MMNAYRKTGYLFEEFMKHVARSDASEPFLDGDGTLIESLISCEMDSGPRIELCLWTSDGMSFWDVSTPKEGSGLSRSESFLSYISSKGLPLENVEDRYGRWRYCGIIEKEDVFRVQFYEEPEV